MTSRRVVTVVTAVAGAALLIWQVERTGLDTIASGLGTVGAGFLAILLLSFLRFAMRSFAWTTLIDERVPLGRAVAASITGDAIGNVTPLSLLVSEPAKALYLGKGVPPARALAALAAETFFYSTTIAVFIIAGCAMMLATFDVPDAVRWAGLISLAAMVAVLVAALWIVWREPSVASAALARVPILNLAPLVEKVRAFEATTYSFVRKSPDRIRVVFAMEILFHVTSVAESYLTLWLLTGRSLPLEAFILDAVNRIVNIVFRVVPFKMGVDELGAGFVSQAIGLGPALGVTLAIVRKGRSLAWAAIGFVLLASRGAGSGQRAEGKGKDGAD